MERSTGVLILISLLIFAGFVVLPFVMVYDFSSGDARLDPGSVVSDDDRDIADLDSRRESGCLCALVASACAASLLLPSPPDPSLASLVLTSCVTRLTHTLACALQFCASLSEKGAVLRCQGLANEFGGQRAS